MSEQLELPLGDQPKVQVVRLFENRLRPTFLKIEDCMNARQFDTARAWVRAAQEDIWHAYVDAYAELYNRKV